MEHKTFQVAEVKAAGAPGEFEALVSVFGNIDDVGDRVLKGAFKRAISEQPPPPVVWSHQWGIPPVGETLDWSEGRDGLKVKGRLFVDEGDKHHYADMVYAAMKSRDGRPPALREFSFAYDIAESALVTEQGADVRELKDIFPVYEVGPTLVGANRSTRPLSAVKAAPVMLGQVTEGDDTTGGFLVWVPSLPPSMTPAADSVSTDPTPVADPETPVSSTIQPWRFPPLHGIDTATAEE